MYQPRPEYVSEQKRKYYQDMITKMFGDYSSKALSGDRTLISFMNHVARDWWYEQTGIRYIRVVAYNDDPTLIMFMLKFTGNKVPHWNQ